MKAAVVIAATIAAVVVVVSLAVVSVVVDAKYVVTASGATVGYNMDRAVMPIPQQPHQVEYPPLDTTPISHKPIAEVAVVCDPSVPVGRTCVCEIHTFDECGNPSGKAINATAGWHIVVEELAHPGSTNRLVSEAIWVQPGVGRFFFTPLRIGLHRVAIARTATPLVETLRVQDNIGASGGAGGFIVHVHDVLAKGLSHNIGDTNKAVQRMLWTQASHNAEEAAWPPHMPATNTFEDREHRFDDRKFGMLQEAIRRAPVQPEKWAAMPKLPARNDDNAFRYVDIVR